jgi:Fe-S-cluster containining protein
MNQKLERVYQQIPNPNTPCSPNCGKCCGILWPSRLEISNIQEWLERRGRKYIDFNMTPSIDCPYLDEDKRCSIYPVRPFLCRILAVSTDLPCPIRLCRHNKPLNHAQSSKLYREIYLTGKQKPLTEKHRKLLRQIL